MSRIQSQNAACVMWGCSLHPCLSQEGWKLQPGARGLGLDVGSCFLPWDFTFRAGFCLSPDLVAQRGEKLELLIDKTENLVDSVSVGKSWEQGGGDSAWRHLKGHRRIKTCRESFPFFKVFSSCIPVWERSSSPCSLCHSQPRVTHPCPHPWCPRWGKPSHYLQ